jgi:hypothetical protein
MTNQREGFNKSKGRYTDKERKELEAEKIKSTPLAKRDFKTLLNHDKSYSKALRQELEHKVVKLDILSAKCQLVPQTKEGTIENIDILTEFSSLQREIYDLKAKLFTLLKLVEDKEQHYNYVFLPQYNKELKESNENIKELLTKCREIIKEEKDDLHSEVRGKMRFEIEVFDSLSKEDRKDEERQLNLYKPLKRLLGAYNKVESDVKEAEKYK